MKPLSWAWVDKCRLLGGNPTIELYEDALAAGSSAVPLMAEVLARRSFREGEPTDCANIPVHAMRVLGALREPGGLPALMGVLSDPVDPGLYGEEAGLALGRVGEPALAPMARLALAGDRDTFVRAGALRALMFAALANRLLRPRVLAVFEELLLDATQRDRTLLAHLVNSTCLLAATNLLSSIAAAFAAGRVDEEVVDLESVEIDLLTRHQRPDRETKELVRRDVREDYVSWFEMTSGLAPEELLRLEGEMRRLDEEEAS